MKNIALYILFTIGLLSITNNVHAAFVIKNSKAEAAATQKVIDKKNTVVQTINNTFTSPKPELINPEHVLGDVITLLSFVLGIIGVIIAFNTGFGVILGILAIVLGIAGKHMEGHTKFAKIGIALGIIAVVIAALFAYVSL